MQAKKNVKTGYVEYLSQKSARYYAATTIPQCNVYSIRINI